MPQAASARLGLVGPSTTDLVSQGDDIIRAIITQLEAVGAKYTVGTDASKGAAAAANAGSFHVATDTSKVYVSSGSAWFALLTPIEIGHSWLVSSEIRVPVGQVDVIPQLFVPVRTGQVATLKRVRYGITAGTSATFKMQRNGVDIGGLTALVAGTTVAETAPSGTTTLANNDRLQPIVTAVSATPQNLSITAVIEHA